MVCRRGSSEPVRVLIVEDDPTVRRLSAAALVAQQHSQIRVREAASIAEGIALVRTCNTMLDGIEEQAALLA